MANQGKQIIHSDKWIHVRADQIETANGDILDPYYVLEYPDWVHIIAITPADEIILLRQYRHAAGMFGLEIPCGGVDAKDNSPIEAAQRELLEETGYKSEQFSSIGISFANPAFFMALSKAGRIIL